MVPRFLSAFRRRPRFWGGLALLALALLATWGTRTVRLSVLAGDADARRHAQATEALNQIGEAYADLRDRLASRAQTLAADSSIRRGLAAVHQGASRPSSLVRTTASLRTAPHTSVEVYTPTPRLVAWTGPRMPMDGAPNTEAFLERPQVALAADGDVRYALAAWAPVRVASGTAVGAVRVVRVVRFRPPVQNRHIRSFSLEADWSERTGERVAVRWGRTERPSEPHRLLYAGTDDRVLGTVTVRLPPEGHIVEAARAQYNNLLALWAVLLAGWVVVGWGIRYLRTARTEPNTTVRRGASIRLFAAAAGGWIGLRYLLLLLDVPSRWLSRGDWLAPLFDPTHLASTLGRGVMRSTGDLLITSGFAVVLAVGLLHVGAGFRVQAPSVDRLWDRLRAVKPGRPSSMAFLGALSAVLAGVLGGVAVLSRFVSRAVLDSTLDFFSRTGLLPQPLVLVVLCALFLLALSVVLAGVGSAWIALRAMLHVRPASWPRGMPVLFVTLTVLAVVGGLYTLTPLPVHVPFPVGMFFLGTVGTAAFFGLLWPDGGIGQLTLRGLLPSLLVLTILLYPLLYAGMDTQRREHMVEASASFSKGRDPRVLFSIQQVLEKAREDLGPLVQEGQSGALPPPVDSVAARLVRRSLLASLTTYEASLVLLDRDGTPRHRYTAAGLQTRRTRPTAADQKAFEAIRTLRPPGTRAPVVDQIRLDAHPDRPAASPFQYAGLMAIYDSTTTATASAPGPEDGTPAPVAWVLLRAEPRSLLPGTGTGVPRVLLPDGSISDLYAELSLAAFQDGTLVRSLGRDFGWATLPDDTKAALQTVDQLWRTESIRGRNYLTYYRHRHPDVRPTSIVAVRIPAVLAFDHLYYLLRLTVAGLCVGAVVYLLGVAGRYRLGLIPADRVRFRDKVLNAFLIVGVVSMISVGVVGVQVVTGENERVIERRLHDDLSRVEETLALEAASGERLWQVADRIDVDSLAARVGLDLQLYDEGRLVATSRPRLVRDRLIDERLPGDVYYALYDQSYRFTTAEASIGAFRYRVGFQALPDDEGRPRIVVSVPTLAQQERIEEEQARTLAYLFGALLLLVVVVMLTALVLANALARPIGQLREGLEAVGEGRFTRVLPVDTRDEIGDLVQTFNEMRDQLAESRRKLAKQERQLAWREMARQVAHEIKNPLTPMKLSIQHLRRAFKREQSATETSETFASLFDRITTTLIEQIEALARIANEFSTFARLPTRVVEPLDLNEVIREAADLMREDEAEVEVLLALHEEPMVVEADREEMRRIYINLIKNAMQAIPEHRDGRIEITTEPVTGSGDVAPAVRSAIRDNGTGIPADLQDKIFQPNFSTKTSGTGLGLAIAKKSIEELDGAIDFETTEGEGTTFWIRLPLAEPAALEETMDES